MGVAAWDLSACTLAASVLTLAGCVSRLWNLHEPATPIYDETHVGRFLNWYHDGAYFFDVHGPLGKLLMYWTATRLGFEGHSSCPYVDPRPYASECSLAPCASTRAMSCYRDWTRCWEMRALR